jgi:hypothetical protein
MPDPDPSVAVTAVSLCTAKISSLYYDLLCRMFSNILNCFLV